MSACRTVLRKADGAWTADKTLTEQVMALGKAVQPIQAKYSIGADIKQAFVNMQQHSYVGGAGLTTLQDDTMFNGRVMTARRSDCLGKWNPNNPLHCRKIGADGDVVVSMRDAVALQMRIPDPKDKDVVVDKDGTWSKWFYVFRIDYDRLVDGNIPHLANRELVAKLDWFEQLYQLEQRMQKQMSTNNSCFFVSKTHKKDGQYQPIGGQRFGNRVSGVLHKAGITVGTKSEEQGGEEHGGKVRGHYIRGHVESLAYELGTRPEVKVNFEPHAMIERAGHFEDTFHKYYSRPVLTTVVARIRAHRNVAALSMEEVMYV